MFTKSDRPLHLFFKLLSVLHLAQQVLIFTGTKRIDKKKSDGEAFTDIIFKLVDNDFLTALEVARARF